MLIRSTLCFCVTCAWNYLSISRFLWFYFWCLHILSFFFSVFSQFFFKLSFQYSSLHRQAWDTSKTKSTRSGRWGKSPLVFLPLTQISSLSLSLSLSRIAPLARLWPLEDPLRRRKVAAAWMEDRAQIRRRWRGLSACWHCGVSVVKKKRCYLQSIFHSSFLVFFGLNRHNLCLDRFGAAWPGEDKPLHGEVSYEKWHLRFENFTYTYLNTHLRLVWACGKRRRARSRWRCPPQDWPSSAPLSLTTIK